MRRFPEKLRPFRVYYYEKIILRDGLFLFKFPKGQIQQFSKELKSRNYLIIKTETDDLLVLDKRKGKSISSPVILEFKIGNWIIQSKDFDLSPEVADVFNSFSNHHPWTPKCLEIHPGVLYLEFSFKEFPLIKEEFLPYISILRKEKEEYFLLISSTRKYLSKELYFFFKDISPLFKKYFIEVLSPEDIFFSSDWDRIRLSVRDPVEKLETIKKCLFWINSKIKNPEEALENLLVLLKLFKREK